MARDKWMWMERVVLRAQTGNSRGGHWGKKQASRPARKKEKMNERIEREAAREESNAKKITQRETSSIGQPKPHIIFLTRMRNSNSPSLVSATGHGIRDLGSEDKFVLSAWSHSIAGICK